MIDGAIILVADDSSDDSELLKRAFQKSGLHNPVQLLTDGRQVIDYLRHEASHSIELPALPLLLFLDLNMPRCTGFNVLDWVRKQPHLQSLPTIVFSNSDQPSDIEESLRLGAHGYWVKPSRFEDLLKMVAKLKAVLSRVTSRLDNDSPIAIAALKIQLVREQTKAQASLSVGVSNTLR